ncbi:MAG: transcription antitermination factor NusB [Clostridia bacterium]|nr:transcription antitermination factor NusB [Clostridia bacterium]
MRRDAREAVYRILYADIFNKDNGEEFKREVFSELGLTSADIGFAEELLGAVMNNEADLKSEIEKLAQGYSFDRIYPTDRCALTLAFAEMTYLKDIPKVASIDEALFLVRKYSTPESLNFVNGILASYKKLLEENK